MTRPPDLTDRHALALHRARALRAGPALFLHEAAAAEIKERLNEVNRTFTAPAVVTPFEKPWAEILPSARLVAADETLTLDPGAHDLVIHALALHWSNDPVGQLIQCRRALKPDGLFLGVLFGGRSLHELRGAMAEAETAILGGLSPRVLPMAEIRDAGGLLQRAGLALPVADCAEISLSYKDLHRLMHDLRAMGETNSLAARHRRPAPRRLFDEAARRYAEIHTMPDGRIPATVEMIYLAGWAPAETQPQALKPGSARMRLADALGAHTPRPGSGDSGSSD
ncbi:methyltransferase domain-containing protein [Rhodovulum visakhapatnamense]|uniref:Methyltransferase family protein n=1 Tax=Rhodovulum visakhapatnamense TaxID=364297 RepID=A0A4R8FZ36_9RHOB|nr:methyltransferase domain-containing protein [Rhodovulum visakhapatnamense]TDX31964.1 methyltransferase family protein [Rhodovulum visakhapatnamense]